ncbi:MAG: DUF4160 domain-containing protein [Isosphaeraceae bacterium]
MRLLCEPCHVHVERDGKTAKFWLDPVRLVWNKGDNLADLKRIEHLVEDHQTDLRRSWDDDFSQ